MFGILFVAKKEVLPIAVKESRSSTLSPTSSLTYPNDNNNFDLDAIVETSSKHSEEDGNNAEQDDDLVMTCSCQKYYQGPHHAYHTKKGPHNKKKIHRRTLSAKRRRQLADRLTNLLYFLRTS